MKHFVLTTILLSFAWSNGMFTELEAQAPPPPEVPEAIEADIEARKMIFAWEEIH